MDRIPRAVIYARISQDREGGGLGVTRQEADCRKLADQLGWPVADVCTDDDISAYSGRRRPGYERMVELLKNGEAHAVIAWHTDRLHRTPRDLEDYIDLADALELRTVTVKTGPIDLGTPSGRAVARTLCAWARFEVEHKSDRALRKARELAEAGKIGNGGPRPFGYQRIYAGGTGNRRKIAAHVIDPDEAAVVREVAQRLLAGEPLRGLCRDLNQRDITTSLGNQWTMQGLKQMILAARMAGLREHHGKVVAEAVWPAIIDRSTHERLRTLLTDPSRFTGVHGHTRYLLTGLLICGRCGEKLRPARSAAVQRFGCRPRGDGGCGGILIRYTPLEQLVVDAILERLDNLTLEPRPADDPTDQLLTAIAGDEQRLQQLGDAFADDPDASPLELRAAGARLRERIAAHRRRLAATTRAQLVADPTTLRSAWPTMPIDQRIAAARLLIEQISIGPARPGNRFEPERVTITWR